MSSFQDLEVFRPYNHEGGPKELRVVDVEQTLCLQGYCERNTSRH